MICTNGIYKMWQKSFGKLIIKWKIQIIKMLSNFLGFWVITNFNSVVPKISWLKIGLCYSKIIHSISFLFLKSFGYYQGNILVYITGPLWSRCFGIFFKLNSKAHKESLNSYCVFVVYSICWTNSWCLMNITVTWYNMQYILTR